MTSLVFRHRNGDTVFETDYLEAETEQEWDASPESREPEWAVNRPLPGDLDRRVRAVRLVGAGFLGTTHATKTGAAMGTVRG